MPATLTELNAVYHDLIATGNTLFESAQTSASGYVPGDFIADLTAKKAALTAEISAMDREIGSDKQDFADNYKETPELKKLHVIEDYTLAIFWLSYIFMAVALVYLYSGGVLTRAAVGLLAAGTVGAILAGLLYWAL